MESDGFEGRVVDLVSELTEFFKSDAIISGLFGRCDIRIMNRLTGAL
jgi:hypothetical protein